MLLLNSIIILTVSLLAGTQTAQAGVMDPLDSAEINKAAAMTFSLPQSEVAKAESAKETVRLEPLLIERHQNEKNTSTRVADVYVYDYTTDETIITQVDLTSNKTLSSKRIKNVQLPLTPNELRRVKKILFSDKEEMELVEAEYLRMTGVTLTDASSLQVKAFILRANNLPERLNSASSECGLQRCAQVLLYVHDSLVFETSPIVNLSASIVTQNISF